jgi:hypothetical protein
LGPRVYLLYDLGPEKGPLDLLLLRFMWLLSPLVMDCRLLIRDSMRFIRYFLLSNLVRKVVIIEVYCYLFLGLTLQNFVKIALVV